MKAFSRRRIPNLRTHPEGLAPHHRRGVPYSWILFLGLWSMVISWALQSRRLGVVVSWDFSNPTAVATTTKSRPTSCFSCDRPTIHNSKDNHNKILPQVNDWWNSSQILTIHRGGRIWHSRRDHSNWCHNITTVERNKELSQRTLIYVKIDKTGSSTLSGINIRLARHMGQRLTTTRTRSTSSLLSSLLLSSKAKSSIPTCSHTFAHGRNYLRNRNRSQALLWSFVREPFSRVTSSFFHFEVSRRGIPATKVQFQAYLDRPRFINFQTKYLLDVHRNKIPQLLKMNSNNNTVDTIHKYIMERFDFIGVSERRMESLAVMSLLWDLPVEDFLVLSAKSSGGYDDGRFQKKCVHIQKPDPIMMQSYRNSSSHFQDSFRLHNRHDYVLYTMVNHSLDITMEALGRDRVDGRIRELRYWQTNVETKCMENTIFPCSQTGKRQRQAASQNCYWEDSGCGYPCVDRVLLDHRH